MQHSPTSLPVPPKRSFSQQSAAAATTPPSKLPRATADPHSFSAARHSPVMASSSNRRHTPRLSEPGTMNSRTSASASGSRGGVSKRGGKHRGSGPPPKNLLEGPYHDERFIEQEHNKSPIPLKEIHKQTPRVPLNNFYSTVTGKQPQYNSIQGTIMDGNQKLQIWRTTVQLDIEPSIVGTGDHPEKKQSIFLAALSSVYQLQELGLLDNPKKLQPARVEATSTTLSDGSQVNYERARGFMDYYCRKFDFGKPDLEFVTTRGAWEVTMTVGGRRIGLGSGSTKKAAQMTCYLDVTKYLESCDSQLWQDYLKAAKTGADLGMAPRVLFQVSSGLDNSIADLCDDIHRTSLYKNRPSKEALDPSQTSDQMQVTNAPPTRPTRHYSSAMLASKSQTLLKRWECYLQDPQMDRMRKSRASLPVYAQAKEILSHIAENEVTILMAATGSGKTTQIPQMILDDFIERGNGSKCNIICTQPRRLAAISVADRVAKERGEILGQSIGYQVRFEAKLPEPDGCVTFCTTGVFLKQLQTALSSESRHGGLSLEEVTHIVVDEVHERDVDTDLLLVVIKQLLAMKKARKQPLKIILMSATIDPALFQSYFSDDSGKPADVISIPGRSFPVTKYFLDDYISDVLQKASWVVQQENVSKYLNKELGTAVAVELGVRMANPEARDEDLELPYPLIGATIAHVLQSSDDGHVLIFLPGWEEIVATQRSILQPLGPLGIPFNDPSKYSIHLLHSSIPLAEQQAIFEPPPPGVRRIILATNIAETSVTIPDIVHVIDAAKIKEQRYDPDRHMSSLVSAWVGSSNLIQRAGRAGRHRSGDYFGILGKARAEALDPYQTVEMKHVDLTNVVMHVKALNFPGMTVEAVLAAAIEPPEPGRVDAALKDLKMVGALDKCKNLTSLGRVLLQLPVDVQVGRLVLYGSFFRCLDEALTLAAILTNRDPFMSPMHLKQEAAQKKNSWTLEEFRSDPLATLRAFNAWWAMQSRGEYVSANRFCVDNFLSKPTLLMIQKIRGHLLQALYRAGVIEVSAGGQSHGTDLSKNIIVPPALNVNKESYPLLVALITVASQPKFAIRTGEKTYRTPNDKTAFIHPSSVNNRKRILATGEENGGTIVEKQLYAFGEKRRNDTVGSATTYLVATTRLDPLTYILFGAYNVEVVEKGLKCDDWLPVFGDVQTLDDLQRLKNHIEGCMLRVFEGITMIRRRNGQKLPILPREEREEESGDEEEQLKDYSLTHTEVKELDFMTRDVVRILNRYSDERIASQSRQNSRAATPISSPYWGHSRLPQDGYASGYSTPGFYHQSRPGTPSRLRRY